MEEIKKKRILVLYHGDDLDGVCSAAIINRRYEYAKEEVDIKNRPISYDTVWLEPKSLEKYDTIFMVDFSFKEYTYLFFKKLVSMGKECYWFDHHEGVINLGIPFPKGVKGGLKVGRSACGIVADYYDIKSDIIDILSDYDVWNKESRFGWDTVESVQYAVRSYVGLDVEMMEDFLEKFEDGSITLEDAENVGIYILNYLEETYKNDVKKYSYEKKMLVDGELVRCLICNTTSFSSMFFGHNMKNYDLCIPFNMLPDGRIRMSFYTERDGDLALRAAKKFGGGGHNKVAGAVLDLGTFINEFKR